MAPLDGDNYNEARLEPDTVPSIDVDDNDSGLASDADSTRSASITSSIIGYKYENGRRYHAYREGSYYLPNDEAEQARLDLLHHIFRLALDGALYLTPLSPDIKRCLDFGTGTGIWAMDFADEFPNTEVIGTDLSPIQPTWVPPNLKFFVDDCESADWGFRTDEGFDFIHGRGMAGSIKDWSALYRQIYKTLNPGGYVEMQEYEGHFHSNADPELSKCPTLKRWVDLVNEGSSKFGKEVDVASKQKQMMIDAGFDDVRERVVPIPLGPWAKGAKAKEMGNFERENILDCVDAFTFGLLTRVLGWTKEECEVIMARTKAEIRDPKNQLFSYFYFVYGRKPSH